LSIERGGIRFGLFGVLGREAATYSVSAAPVTFTDPVDAARAAVSMLRDTEKVDQDIRRSQSSTSSSSDRDIDALRFAFMGCSLRSGRDRQRKLLWPVAPGDGRTIDNALFRCGAAASAHRTSRRAIPGRAR